MNKPLVIFDWDGVLFDTNTVMAESYRLVTRELGLPMPDAETLRSFVGPTDDQNAHTLGLTEDADIQRFIKLLWAREFDVVRERGELYPGIRELLFALHGKCTLALVSNGGYNHVHAGLVQFGILPLFDDVTTARAGKSKPDSFRRLMATFPHGKVIAAGDRGSDIRAGLEVGAYVVASNYGFGCMEEFQGANAIADTVEELGKAIFAAFAPLS